MDLNRAIPRRPSASVVVAPEGRGPACDGPAPRIARPAAAQRLGAAPPPPTAARGAPATIARAGGKPQAVRPRTPVALHGPRAASLRTAPAPSRGAGPRPRRRRSVASVADRRGRHRTGDGCGAHPRCPRVVADPTSCGATGPAPYGSRLAPSTRRRCGSTLRTAALRPVAHARRPPRAPSPMRARRSPPRRPRVPAAPSPRRPRAPPALAPGRRFAAPPSAPVCRIP